MIAGGLCVGQHATVIVVFDGAISVWVFTEVQGGHWGHTPAWFCYAPFSLIVEGCSAGHILCCSHCHKAWVAWVCLSRRWLLMLVFCGYREQVVGCQWSLHSGHFTVVTSQWAYCRMKAILMSQQNVVWSTVSVVLDKVEWQCIQFPGCHKYNMVSWGGTVQGHLRGVQVHCVLCSTGHCVWSVTVWWSVTV